MGQLSWQDSYMGKLRAALGQEKLMNVACRGILLDEDNRVLLVQRNDTQKWVMPAGSMEVNESVMDALKREVYEETGLFIEEAKLIAVYSNPHQYSYESMGFSYQMLAFVFLVQKWSGELLSCTEETDNADFFHLENLPDDVPDLYLETIEDLKKHQKTGEVILK